MDIYMYMCDLSPFDIAQMTTSSHARNTNKNNSRGNLNVICAISNGKRYSNVHICTLLSYLEFKYEDRVCGGRRSQWVCVKTSKVLIDIWGPN